MTIGGPDPYKQCRAGHRDYFCSICEDGYVKDDSTGACISCENSAKLSQVSVIPIFLFFFFIIVIYYRRQIRAYVNDLMKSCIDKLNNYNVKGIQTKLKILVGFVQIVMQMSVVLDLFFPELYNDFLRMFAFLNILNFSVFFFDLGCTYTIDFYVKLLVQTISPILVMACLCLWFYFRHIYSLRLNRKNPSFNREQMIENMVYSILLVCFLVFSPVSTTVFQTFGCEDFEDGSTRLVADYTIECNFNESGTRKFYFCYAIFMSLVYPAGIPLLYLSLLLYYKDKVNPLSTTVVRVEEKDLLSKVVINREKSKTRKAFPEIKKISFLYENYKPSCWYFEVVSCLNRLMIGTIPILVLRGTMSQIVFTLIITLAFTAITMLLKPYQSYNDNKLAIVSMWSISLVLISAALIRVASYEEEDVDLNLIGAILIIINIFVVVFSIYMAIGNVDGLPLDIRDSDASDADKDDLDNQDFEDVEDEYDYDEDLDSYYDANDTKKEKEKRNSSVADSSETLNPLGRPKRVREKSIELRKSSYKESIDTTKGDSSIISQFLSSSFYEGGDSDDEISNKGSIGNNIKSSSSEAASNKSLNSTSHISNFNQFLSSSGNNEGDSDDELSIRGSVSNNK